MSDTSEVWHRLGAAWKSKKDGTIALVLDVGVAVTFLPGTKLVHRGVNTTIMRFDVFVLNFSVDILKRSLI